MAAPQSATLLAASFAGLTESYMAQVDWESRAEIEARVATLLPALLLARVDGKSPVEYLGDAAPRVRAAALTMLGAPRDRIADVQTDFTKLMEQR